MSKEVASKAVEPQVKEARFIRFPPQIDQWMTETHGKRGFKNVNQLVVDLVRKEWQRAQSTTA